MFDINNRRYTGSKHKLNDWIFENISQNCEGRSFFDIFGGTGVVSARAYEEGFEEIIVNDFLFSNKVIYDAFFSDDEVNEEKVNDIKNRYNGFLPGSENYFSKNFGDNYFSKDNSILIGQIREDIDLLHKCESINKREHDILLASLIYSMDKVSNTVGHYEAYLRNAKTNKRIVYKLIDFLKYSSPKFDIHRTDANEIANCIGADIIYIDPPYNSRQYSRFYHVIETLVHWDERELYGVALKPTPENMSDYCRNAAPKVFRDLISKLKCKYIVVSYNNTFKSKSKSSMNKITLEQIETILAERGETTISSVSHKAFNTGKTELNNHKEYLFITRVVNS